MKPPRSLAIIEPMGDYGVGGYVYELAEGLAANGVRIDVSAHHGAEDAPRRRLTPPTEVFVFERNVDGGGCVQNEF